MLQDPNVERYIEIAVKPLKKEIEQMKAQIEALNQAVHIHDVVGRSELLNAFRQWARENLDDEDIVTQKAVDRYLESIQ